MADLSRAIRQLTYKLQDTLCKDVDDRNAEGCKEPVSFAEGLSRLNGLCFELTVLVARAKTLKLAFPHQSSTPTSSAMSHHPDESGSLLDQGVGDGAAALAASAGLAVDTAAMARLQNKLEEMQSSLVQLRNSVDQKDVSWN
jgi:hypothetical protein